MHILLQRILEATPATFAIRVAEYCPGGVFRVGLLSDAYVRALFNHWPWSWFNFLFHSDIRARLAALKKFEFRFRMQNRVYVCSSICRAVALAAHALHVWGEVGPVMMRVTQSTIADMLLFAVVQCCVLHATGKMWELFGFAQKWSGAPDHCFCDIS